MLREGNIQMVSRVISLSITSKDTFTTMYVAYECPDDFQKSWVIT